MREYFLITERCGFSKWETKDTELARLLWGDPEVTHFICASGVFKDEEIECRLETEIRKGELYGVQYWPLFERNTGELIGCCGLRPFEGEERAYELGCHLREKYWGKGIAKEAAEAVIAYGFGILGAQKLLAGHHPQNIRSGKVLKKLGFTPIGEKFYEPTGLFHPAYELTKPV